MGIWSRFWNWYENKILGSVMGKVTKKTTGAELSRIITAETNSLLKKYMFPRRIECDRKI